MNKKTKIKLFICLVAIIFAILVTYKITNPIVLIPEPEIDEYPVSSSEYLIKQNEKMDKIIAFFNDIKLISKYVSNYSVLRAFREGNTIVVEYKDNKWDRKYVFVLDSDTLSINVSNEETIVFDEIFKIMFEANQKRLGNNSDFSDYLRRISNHNISTKSISISSRGNFFDYNINIDEMIVLLKD